MSYTDDYDAYLREAWSLYQKGVDAEGERRRAYLKDAKQVLYNVPEGYSNRDDLMSRIEAML